MRTLRYLSAGLLALAASCGSNDVTTPTVDVTAVVDQASGSGSSSYSSAAFAASVPGVAPAIAVPSSAMSACTYTATTQRFECQPMTMNGLTITRSFALLDATGQPLSTPNPAAVASIRTITDVKGTMSTPGATTQSLTIDRHEDATMSDLRSAVHTLNGTSTLKLDFALSGATYSSNEASTTANLKLPQPTAAVHWPLGGTITTDRTMTITSLAAITSHEVLAFDGTSVMTLTTTAGPLTRTCKFDLSKPGTPPTCT